MFDSIGWGEILVLIVAGLFILGPERLPEAAAWLGRTVRKVRDFATGARQQLRDEVGTDFEEFRKPIEDLRNLRNFDPKHAVREHLFDGDPDPLGLNNINGAGPVNGNGVHGVHGAPASAPQQAEPLKPGEKPPVDPDAT
ncbi:Sec-independent protein translocase protein TatB [Saccharomonospora xinjiangensis]|uniref:Sec-independent protein translocase protein TatB n=1 Tax=Saccharomonospora xinjiangensis XJ-54 TaxID=882086 RepID=I0V0E5_9PSEU|nr:Sec-independent protein translocase protein TatB [Saccharomonospora xinjiangensis]EID53598.1 twin arginine-targeting protein translocase TatB [Saccharomonospora xinjiangensis XJ-54]